MFWKFMIGVSKFAFHAQKAATGIGAAVIITLVVKDYLNSRKNDR
jgi:hypothetical protein